ncbi:MAG: PaaI family thioesterase [Acidimicrobiia bacterium]
MAYETPAIKGAHVYQHLGAYSTYISDSSGETRMPIADDIRTNAAVRSAPMGLAFEQGVATYVFKKVLAVPTQISLHVRDRGEGLNGIVSTTNLIRLGRTTIVTDGVIVDEADPSRKIAYGYITWAVLGDAPTPGEPPVIPEREPGRPGIIEALGITALPDGNGCRLEGVSSQIAGPGGILHAGMFQMLSEEAALVAARTASGSDRAWATDCTYNFLQPGRVGPFVATAEALYQSDQGVDVKVTIRDEGSDGRIGCVSFLRVRTD